MTTEANLSIISGDLSCLVILKDFSFNSAKTPLSPFLETNISFGILYSEKAISIKSPVLMSASFSDPLVLIIALM